MEDALKGSKIAEETDRDLLDDLFFRSDEPDVDDADKELDTPTLVVNLTEVNSQAEKEATEIIDRLSGYYFDETYLNEHPYIPNKIAQEMNNIRRLLKMLAVNEKAQDSLITSITSNSGKGSLYQSLTSLQNTTLSIQSQLNTLTSNIEGIFKEMQDECERTWSDKEKETNADGSLTVRGSREFIKELNARLHEEKTDKEEIDVAEIVQAS